MVIKEILRSLVNLNAGFKIQVEICVVQVYYVVGKVYQLDCEPVSAERASVALKQHSDLDLWHQRLGHLNAQCFKEAIQKKLVNSVKIQKITKLSFTEGCVEGKMHQQTFKSVGEISSTRKL